MPWHQFLSGEGLLGSALCEEKAVWPKGSREPIKVLLGELFLKTAHSSIPF